MHYLTEAGLEFLEEAKKMGLLKKAATVGALCVGASCKGPGASISAPQSAPHPLAQYDTPQKMSKYIDSVVYRKQRRDDANIRQARISGMIPHPDSTSNPRRMKYKRDWLRIGKDLGAEHDEPNMQPRHVDRISRKSIPDN
tara:strand:+ start:495 stop:917 length:423 start_codon:yes stop_codon:yes gene_type:complete